MFLQKIDVSETIFRNGNFSIIKDKLGGPILESSLHFRNSRKHVHRFTSFGAVDWDIGKKAIFVRFRRFFIVRTKIGVLGQNLPFLGIKTAVLEATFS